MSVTLLTMASGYIRTYGKAEDVITWLQQSSFQMLQGLERPKNYYLALLLALGLVASLAVET